MDSKILIINDTKIDLSKLTRIFPAVEVSLNNDKALVSIEWAESKADKIDIKSFVLALDTDPIGEVPVNRIELRFDTKLELLDALERIANA